MKQITLTASNHLRDCQRRLQSCNTAITQFEKQRRNLKLNMQKIEDRVEKLQHDIEEAKSRPGYMDQLQKDLANAREEKDQATAAFQEAVATIDEANEDIKPVRARADALLAEINEAQGRIDDAEEAVKGCGIRWQQYLQEKNKIGVEVEAAQREKTQINSALQIAREDVVALDTQAREQTAGIRVPLDEGETLASLTAKIRKLNQDIERRNQE
jgi:chromosome segregation ATPase